MRTRALQASPAPRARRCESCWDFLESHCESSHNRAPRCLHVVDSTFHDSDQLLRPGRVKAGGQNISIRPLSLLSPPTRAEKPDMAPQMLSQLRKVMGRRSRRAAPGDAHEP